MRFLPLLFITLLLGGCLPPATPPAVPATSQLTARGEGSVKVKPNQVEMTLEAVTQAANAEEALEQNSTAIAKLQKLLEANGLQPDEYRTGQFSVQPQWSRPPRPAPSNWTPEIVAYRVNNSLQIKTSHIELAGRLLALAQKADANQVGNLRFSLADSESASLEAIAVATAHARQRAATLAAAAGVKLGDLLEARVEDGNGGVQPMAMMAEASANHAATPTVPISAGEIEVRATVVLRYAVSNP